MFTGIVHCIGEIAARRGDAKEARFTILPQTAFASPEVGESVAVNGVCLTVENFSGNAFTAYASEETLSVSTLNDLRPGALVNLERAATLGTRLGGHLVSGHVDCLATIAAVESRGASTVFRLDFPRAMGHLIVPKGSVALDGVSLTVNDCGSNFFTVNIIPETLRATIIREWRIGRSVNMETDVVGKYVARMLEAGYAGRSSEQIGSPRLTMDFLRENGF